ncbi:hypothetical protein F5Y17DRAFT_231016 [Xylariaceae sp. FL0594]|nr:hypothetical protein F5Y17DRAFT_231016 [Xylariaceae sp. FL0594]
MEDVMDDAPLLEGRTFPELLADVSVNRIWGYLDWAIENATYFGPWSERPSERHTKANREAYEQAMREERELYGDTDDEA